MGIFFVYILKSGICLALFYLFYKLLLSRETFHRFNRVALLGILVLSLLIPLIEVTTQHQTEVGQTMLTLEQILAMAELSSNAVTANQTLDVSFSATQFALLIYLAGILLFLCRNLYSLGRLLLLLRAGRREKLASGITLVVHQKELAPFSWVKYIVISEKDLKENGHEILIHETAHIRNRHSIDLLIADICIFFQWFNPASWLLKQELQNIHEYEADETVIKNGVDAKQYQLLLIKKAVGTRLYSMANSFNHSTLKKRITMMLKEKSNPWARLKYLYVLPLAAVAVTVFARPEILEKAEAISAVKVNDLTAIVETKIAENVIPQQKKDSLQLKGKVVGVKKGTGESEVFDMVEKMPEFPGGTVMLMKYLKDNMIYPQDLRNKGVQGRVIVQFVVDKQGQLTSPKVVHSVNKAMDEEAIRLVKSMPKWIPGTQGGKKVAVKYTLPVAFIIKDETSDGLVLRTPNNKEPLVIIDGKEVSKQIMSAINPDRIESITVLKDKSALDLYGDKGQNGVILITLKEENGQSAQKAYSFGVVTELDSEGKINVTGKVEDEKGRPISGVSVVVEGLTLGVVSDAKGYFSLKIPEGATIVASYINMKTVKMKIEHDIPVVIIMTKEE